MPGSAKKKPRQNIIKERTDPRRNLKQFISQEFAIKKPLEARLIQLKPNVVFKKGTMLPNLLIKMRGKIQFIGYFNFGDEERLYFFNKLGENVGAENHPKEASVLPKLKGKIQTLYRLPKRDPNEGFDHVNQEIQSELSKRIHRMAAHFNLPIPEIPSVSMVKKLSNPNSLRIGVKIENSIIHINQNLWVSVLENFFYDREVFLAFFTGESSQEEFILLATQWSLLKNPEARKLLNTAFGKIRGSLSPILQKYWEWMYKRLFLANIEITRYSEILFTCGLIFNGMHSPIAPTLLPIFLMWNMKSGPFSFKDFSQLPNFRLQKAWLIHRLYLLLFTNSSLLQKYQLGLDKFAEKQPIELLWFHYFLESWYLHSENPTDFKKPHLALPKEYIKSTYSEFLNLFIDKQLLPALRMVPIPVQEQLAPLFHEIFQKMFLHQLLQIDVQKPDIIRCNSKSKWSIHLKNQGDWILHETHFFATITPTNRADISFAPPPVVTVFDTTLDLEIQLKTTNITGKTKLQIGCNYKSPFFLPHASELILYSCEFQIRK